MTSALTDRGDAVRPAVPYPIESPTTKPFWQGLRDGRLMLMRCRECRRWYWPYSACREDHNLPYLENMVWEEASGEGTIFSFSLHLQQFHPAFVPPHAYGVVELAEGPLLPAAIVGLGDSGSVAAVGRPVVASFRMVDERLTVLDFRVRDE